MIIWSAYFLDSGVFTGRTKGATNPDWEPPVLEGIGWKQGVFDRLTQRVDESGEVVEYVPEPPPLEELKAQRWTQIKADRVFAEYAGFVVPGIGAFQSDPDSQRLITGSVVLAQLALMQGKSFLVVWTLADNSTAELDTMMMIAVGVALGQHVEACHVAGRTARAALEAATTPEEVAAVSFSLP